MLVLRIDSFCSCVVAGRYQKSPLSQTQSVPSIPVSVATNGNQDSKDFDSIYESVINFDTNLKNSTPDIRKAENKENNNTLVRDLEAKHAETRAGSMISEVPKTNGSYGDSKHITVDQKFGAETPDPPKRPVRKKRSMRHNRDDLSRQSSGSSQGKPENKTKMPMEYLSDSPEMSPRDQIHDIERKSSAEKSPDLQLKNAESENETKQNGICESDSKLSQPENFEAVNDLSSESCFVKSVADFSEHSLPLSEELSKEISFLRIGTEKDNTGIGKISEVGESSSKTDLEVERTDFESQKRNFGKADFQSLCQEESENQTVVEDYIAEKLKCKDFPSDTNTRTLGSQKLSTSVESLEDIDKILKEQVQFQITLLYSLKSLVVYIQSYLQYLHGLNGLEIFTL